MPAEVTDNVNIAESPYSPSVEPSESVPLPLNVPIAQSGSFCITNVFVTTSVHFALATLVALIVAVNLPARTGVPDILPVVAFMLSPVGSRKH